MKAKFIQQRLLALKKDSAWLAAKCGVKKITVEHNYFRGLLPSKSVLMLMAAALGCKTSDLLYEHEEDDKSA